VAVSRYCLDTSAYSHFKRGDAAVVELIEHAEWLGLPAVVLGQLWSGFLLGSRRERNEAELLAFLAHPSVETVAVDREVGRIYAQIVVALRRAGTPLPTNDIWIAACAVRAGAVVVTYDPHFRAIEGAGSMVLPLPS
jgi:tRNA(fMet)-specific endonuclease VapC